MQSSRVIFFEIVTYTNLISMIRFFNLWPAKKAHSTQERSAQTWLRNKNQAATKSTITPTRRGFKLKLLTVLVCSNYNDRVIGWSISFHSRCKHCDIVVDVLLKSCQILSTIIGTNQNTFIVILCLWLVSNGVTRDDTILFISWNFIPRD